MVHLRSHFELVETEIDHTPWVYGVRALDRLRPGLIECVADPEVRGNPIMSSRPADLDPDLRGLGLRGLGRSKYEVRSQNTLAFWCRRSPDTNPLERSRFARDACTSPALA
jgi:hypothetical protein